MKRLIPWIITGVLALSAGVYLLLCVLADTEHMLPGTVVNGVSLGHMTLEEATDTLKKKETKKENESARLLVAFEGKSYTVEIGNALELDCEAAAKKAFSKSRAKFPVRGFLWIKSALLGNHVQYPPAVKDTDALHQTIADSGLLDAGTTVQTTYQTEGDRLIFTIGTAGEDVDEEALAEKIRTAVKDDDYENVIACPDKHGEVMPVDLDRVYEDIHIEAANATLDPENNYAIVEAVTGVSFDREAAQAALDGAEEGSTVAVDLIYTEPEIDAQNLADHLFTDTLSSFTTKVSGTQNRLINVALATEKCNGSIVISGGVFSFNNTVGEQTEATGFKTANGILDGQIVQVYGGGICQVSSNIFAAALFANLGIVERWEHDYVSGYIAAGVDAAVAWDALDLKIANTRSYPVRIDAVYADGSLTVNIVGTKTEETPVEIETKILDNAAPGTLAVETYRKVFNADKSQVFVEKVADSTYIN